MEAVCRVIDSQPLTPTTHVVRIEKPVGFEFQAGQHVSLELDTTDGPDDRFLSIASAPHEAHLEFAVRLSDSEFKQAFQRLRAGDEVTLMGPSGRFKRDPERAAVLVSGGIGITPLRSMLLDASQRGLPATRLVYGNRSPADIPYHDQLNAAPGTQVWHTVDEPNPEWTGSTGHIDAPLIDQAREGLDQPLFYLCGPPGMVLAITKTLSDMGIKDLRVENFNGY
ncbi:MAG: ferredoxin--NADP reductase [Thermoplasmatota archaeon]